MLSLVFFKQLILKLCRVLGLITKKTNLIIENIPTFSTENFEIHFYVSSSNNLLIFKGDKTFYLRPCNKHVNRKSIIPEIFYLFELLIGNVPVKEPRTLMSRYKFISMGTINNPKSRIYKYFKLGDLSVVGLEQSELSHDNKEDIDFFLHYAWSEISEQKTNINSGNANLFRYNRYKAQEVLYSLFGVEYLICTSNLIKIQTKSDNYLLGNIVEAAEGVNPIEYNKHLDYSMIAPTVVRDLNIMNIMDVLCVEKDHRPGNYNVVFNANGLISSIKAFDNDSAFAFFVTPSISTKIYGCSPIELNGKVNRAHMDKNFVENFLSIKDDILVKSVSEYLNKIQIYFLLIRFHKIKRIFQNTINDNRKFLVSKDNWSSDMINEDISNLYGKTYLQCLIDWREVEKDPIQLRQRCTKTKITTLCRNS